MEEISVGIEEKVNEIGVSLRLDGRMLVARINWNRREEEKNKSENEHSGKKSLLD